MRKVTKLYLEHAEDAVDDTRRFWIKLISIALLQSPFYTKLADTRTHYTNVQWAFQTAGYSPSTSPSIGSKTPYSHISPLHKSYWPCSTPSSIFKTHQSIENLHLV